MISLKAKREQIASASRRWRSRNPASSSAASERWRKKNLPAVAARAKRRREQNQEESRAYVLACQKRNMEAYLLTERNKYRSNEEYRKKKILNAKLRPGRVKQATPAWADLHAISAVYSAASAAGARSGVPHHVDHVYPIKHKLFSGLNVHWNLRVIPARENMKKGNRISSDMLCPRVSI